MILDKINHPNDIHKIDLAEFDPLAKEIRKFLVQSVSRTGGHLASNLGVVELTLALHNVLHFPEDKLIWDVGHQAYTHKILSGRKEEFRNLRQKNGLSGFPKRSESDCDAFDTGHSSNSISAGLGYVKARDLLHQEHTVVSVIGDGALTGGMAYEALNNAAELKTNFIIVINDNNMSIAPNVGGMSSYLSTLRTAETYTGVKMNITRSLNKIPKVGSSIVNTVRKTKSGIKQLIIPGMLFENMGLTYLGPVDGHNTRQVMKLLNEAKKVEGAVVVHVLTKKGLGYKPALEHPEQFHGLGPFDIVSGKANGKKTNVDYTTVFSNCICRLAEENQRIVGITAAMPHGTGLDQLCQKYPKRFFDVGIAEEHAVSFAAGLALGGMIPVVAIYSSFLQRAIDQLIHDVCMQKLHVIFAIDRAGLVGADGETHQGVFDLSYLSMIPNMVVMAPKNAWELEKMLEFAISYDGPIAIRYPRGSACLDFEENTEEIVCGKSEVIEKGTDIAVIGVGSMLPVCRQVCDKIKEYGKQPTLVNARFVKPIDRALLDELAQDHQMVIILEENMKNGGYGEHVAAYMAVCHPNVSVRPIAIWDQFVEQGEVAQLRSEIGLNADNIMNDIAYFLK